MRLGLTVVCFDNNLLHFSHKISAPASPFAECCVCALVGRKKEFELELLHWSNSGNCRISAGTHTPSFAFGMIFKK